MPTKKGLFHPILFCIVGLFIAPILGAYYFYYSGYALRHHIPQGTLIYPPIQTPHTRTWAIASMPNPRITTHLKAMSKRWWALGKDRNRVTLHIFAKSLPQKTTLWPIKKLSSSQFTILSSTRTKQKKPCQWFILDPRGHVVLCYPENTEPRSIDQDLRKLLKTSRIG